MKSSFKKSTLIVSIIFLLVGCTYGAQSIGGGTLGVSAKTTLNHDLTYVKELLDSITLLPENKVKIESMKWWKEEGYDFLDYWLFKFEGAEYCVTFHEPTKDLAIRAFCKGKNEVDWKFAADFTKNEHKKAEIALNHLTVYFP